MMDSKNEAMKNFKDALNNSNQEKEKKKEKQEDKQKKLENERQQYKPTNNIRENNDEKEKELSEEQKEQEERDDRKRYNIYDDDIDDEEDEKNSNNGNINRRKNNKDNNKDDDNNSNNKDDDDYNDSKQEDNSKDDSTSESSSDFRDDKNNSIDDDSNKSSKSSSDSNKSKSDNKSSNGQESDNQPPEQYRPNNMDSTAAQGTNGAAEGTTAATEGAAAETAAGATATGATAGAAAEGGTAATAAAGAATAPLWLVILIIVAAILIIIIVIGYISFFTSGPGLVREKILKFADGIWVSVKGFFIGQDEAQVTDEQIGDVAMYLENMGYDLANYGFLDTDGKPVTVEKNDDGTSTVKSGNKVLYNKVIDEETGEIKVDKIESKYIKAYLAAENNTYMIANKNLTITDLFFGNLLDTDSWGTGMIHMENGSSKVEIDRETKKMQITYHDYVYQYDLDGWTGRYGKSIEFLLTMHLATMAPDFVYDIVKEEEFDTKVNIALYPINASIKLKMPDPNDEEKLIEITEDNWQILGLSESQWLAVKEYNKDDVETFTPFITSVTNHWYKDLDFSKCYVVAENEEGTEDDEAFTSTYQYVGLGEENDVLADVENLYVEEVRKKDIFQIKEPAAKKNELIKEMLLGGKEGEENTEEKYKYYIYNGSMIPENGLEKQYIINKVQLGDGETKNIMNTRTFTYAFAILESVHSEDAEYVLRDLKELFKDVGIEVDELEDDKGSEDSITPLVWPIENYKPIVWDPIYDAQTAKVNIKHKTDSTLGFEPDMNVVMPADGEIIQITREDEKSNTENGEEQLRLGDSIKIRLTGTDRKDIEDMYIYISGLKLDDNISEGDIYSSKTKIGETIKSDIVIIMTDSKRKAVYNVDEYIVPEEWKALEETDEISDSNFGGDVFGNEGGTTQIEGDHNVNILSGENLITDKEKIIAALEWYQSANPEGYNNIVNNIDYFMQIQNQYHVNAIFGIAVAITESGAGTSWDYIAQYTYNWMSLQGAYKGRSYYSYNGVNWRWYNSFGEATIDFGNWIANSAYYFNSGKNTVSQIAPTYCDVSWGNTVNGYMTRILSNIR